jgi:hypothetical protein
MTSFIETQANLLEWVSKKWPETRKRLLHWSLLFVATVALFVVIVRIDELRAFDVFFWPAAVLLFVVTLGFGFVVGSTLGVRWALAHGRKAKTPEPEA